MEQKFSILQAMGLPQAQFTVKLPSADFQMYTEDSTLHGKTHLTLKRMGAEQEDILGNTDLVQSGQFVDMLLSQIILDNIDVKELHPKDKDALMIEARNKSIKSEYTSIAVCPNKLCNHVEENFHFDLNGFETKAPSKDVELVDTNLFKTRLQDFPSIDIYFKLLNGYEIQELEERARKAVKKGLNFSGTTEEVKSKIVKLVFDFNNDKVTCEEPLQIQEFVSNLTLGQIQEFKKIYEEAQPQLNLARPFHCPKCKQKGEVGVPLDIRFFWSQAK